MSAGYCMRRLLQYAAVKTVQGSFAQQLVNQCVGLLRSVCLHAGSGRPRPLQAELQRSVTALCADIELRLFCLRPPKKVLLKPCMPVHFQASRLL